MTHPPTLKESTRQGAAVERPHRGPQRDPTIEPCRPAVTDPSVARADGTGADARPAMIDLFAGCGGGSMGFVSAGLRVAAAVELDTDAAESYRMNLGVKPIVRDIRDVAGEELLELAGLQPGECKLVFGCPPCQSFTVLRRAVTPTAIDVARETLPAQYTRLVADVQPEFVAFENVAGMVEGRGRVVFDELRAELERLGYKLVWDVIDAADYGVPQHRRRLLVLGSRSGTPTLPTPSHASSRSGGRPPHVTVREAIGHLPTLGSGEADPYDEFHRARSHDAITLRRLRAIPEGGGRLDLPADLQLACHLDHKGHYDVYGRMHWDRPAPTITSGCTNLTRGRFAHPEQDRAITLREAMLLQTMPPTTRLSGTGEGKAQQVGNAVPTSLADLLGRAVLASVTASATEATAA